MTKSYYLNSGLHTFSIIIIIIIIIIIREFFIAIIIFCMERG